jgi:hypothetical protein
MLRFFSSALLTSILLSICTCSAGLTEFGGVSEQQVTIDKDPIDHEDFTSLQLTTPLKAVPPLLADVAEHPEFTLQLLQVGWRKGDPIDLYVIKPKGVAKPPVILYLYGYPSETDRFTNDEFCRIVTQNGFAAVGFVAPLDGHRYHDRPMREWFVSELHEVLITSVHDVQMILNYLATRGDLDMDRVGMFGQGSGGTIAVLAASVDKRLKAVNLLDPWGDWPDWMAQSRLIPEDERTDYRSANFLNRLVQVDPVDVLPKLKIPVHLQDVLFERDTPVSSKERLEAAMPHHAMITRYSTKQQFDADLADGKLLAWIENQLTEVRVPKSASVVDTQIR